MTEQAILQWISGYGYPALFVLLALGVVGLPIPDRWLLVFSGYLVFKQVLAPAPTLAVGVLGSAFGLTISYFIGRSSGFVVRRCGPWLAIDGKRMLRAQQWFHRLGWWIVIVGPFIPGLRNVMGYAAGASQLRLLSFERFAFPGALISSLTLLAIGYFVGPHMEWLRNHSRWPIIAIAVLGALLLTGVLLRLPTWLAKKCKTETLDSQE